MRKLSKTAILPLIIAIACSVLFFILSMLATFADKTTIRGHVATAFSANQYGGLSTIQDCLVIYELLAPYEARWEEVLFPKIKNVPDQSCGDVSELLAGEQHSWARYTRYLHGQRTLAGIVLSRMDFAAAGQFLLITSYLILATGIVVLLSRRRREKERTPLFTFGPLLLACLMTFYVTQRHGTSFAFGTADGVVYLLLLLAVTLNLSRMSSYRLMMVAALFGSTAAYVEFLTGQAPLAFACFVALFAASASTHDRAADLAQRCLWTSYAFVAAFVAMFTIKLTVVSLLNYEQSVIFTSQLLYQMNGAIAPELQMPVRYGIDITQYAMYSWQSILYLAIELGHHMRTICRDNILAGFFLMAAAILGLVLGGVSRWHQLPSRLERTRTIVLIGAATVVPAWYLLFPHHSIVGAIFMIRPLVISIAIGLWLGASELYGRLSALLPTRMPVASDGAAH
jgi:hypothetical protein